MVREDASERIDRRSFLGGLGVAISGVVAVAAGVVSAWYLAAPALRALSAKGGQEGWSRVPDATPAAINAPKAYEVTAQSQAGWSVVATRGAVYLDRAPDGGLVAFSARCPHEGCHVDWRSEPGLFVCPCHDSRWDRAGERLSGPTKRGLDPLEVRHGDGGVEVRYVQFALDSPDRIEVG